MNCPTCGHFCVGVDAGAMPVVNPPAGAGVALTFVALPGAPAMAGAPWKPILGAGAAGVPLTTIVGNGYRPIWGQGAVS